jgi:hypothetical protein
MSDRYSSTYMLHNLLHQDSFGTKKLQRHRLTLICLSTYGDAAAKQMNPDVSGDGAYMLKSIFQTYVDRYVL